MEENLNDEKVLELKSPNIIDLLVLKKGNTKETFLFKIQN